jgi:prepilin-type N-terminal cleavage/methylation domain-containing protein
VVKRGAGFSPRECGYSLLEVIVAMAIFGMFMAVLFTLTAEMRYYEKRLPVNMHRHPQVIAVLTRMRRDVMDATSRQPWQKTYDGYTSSDKVMIIETLVNGGTQTVVWDFRTPGEVRRRAYNVGVADEWVARGLPADFSGLEIEAIRTSPAAAWAARIQAKDGSGRLAIDTILQPRATE